MKSGGWDTTNIAEAEGRDRVNLRQYGELCHERRDMRLTSMKKGSRDQLGRRAFFGQTGRDV